MAKKSPDKTQKTNAARLLDRAGVAYRLVPYPVDEEHLEATHLKKAARAIGAKKVEMIHVRELLPLTGYIRGGCSPVGMKTKLPTFIQRDCLELEEMFVSAGQRGLQVAIAPRALVDFTQATPTDLTIEK